jgi:peptide deformylase
MVLVLLFKPFKIIIRKNKPLSTSTNNSILKYTNNLENDILHTKSTPVQFNNNPEGAKQQITSVANQLLSTIQKQQIVLPIACAAIQIGIPKRIFIMPSYMLPTKIAQQTEFGILYNHVPIPCETTPHMTTVKNSYATTAAPSSSSSSSKKNNLSSSHNNNNNKHKDNISHHNLVNEDEIDHPQDVQMSVIVNPFVLHSSKQTNLYLETCLSFPDDVTFAVERPNTVTVLISGIVDDDNVHPTISTWTCTLHDFYARVFLHEMDHLDGIVMSQRQVDLNKPSILSKYGKKYIENLKYISVCHREQIKEEMNNRVRSRSNSSNNNTSNKDLKLVLE